MPTPSPVEVILEAVMNKKIARLLHDWILVELEPPPTETKSGIIKVFPDHDPVRIGKVLLTGPGREWRDRRTKKWSFHPMDVEPGDRVVFLMGAMDTKQGQQLRNYSLGENQGLLRATDVLMVIPEGEEVEVTL